MGYGEPSEVCLLKTLPNWVGATATLRQSTNWRALFGGFPPLARLLHCGPALMEKGLFLWVFCRRSLQGM